MHVISLHSGVCVCISIHTHTHAHILMYVFMTGKVGMTRNKVFVLWSVFWVFLCHATCFVQQLYPEYKYTFYYDINSMGCYKCFSPVSVKIKFNHRWWFHQHLSETVMDVGDNDLSHHSLKTSPVWGSGVGKACSMSGVLMVILHFLFSEVFNFSCPSVISVLWLFILSFGSLNLSFRGRIPCRNQLQVLKVVNKTFC